MTKEQFSIEYISLHLKPSSLVPIRTHNHVPPMKLYCKRSHSKHSKRSQ